MLSLASLLNPKGDAKNTHESNISLSISTSSPTSSSEPKSPISEDRGHQVDGCHNCIPLPIGPRTKLPPRSPRMRAGPSMYNSPHIPFNQFHQSPIPHMQSPSYQSIYNGSSSPYALSSGCQPNSHFVPDQHYSPSHQRVREEQYALEANKPLMPNNTTVQLYNNPATSMIPRHRIQTSSRDSQFPKSPITGPVNYPPFENLDETSNALMWRFNVQPFNQISENSSHIPYNSGKKDFFEKTGRESFEVFTYSYTIPEINVESYIMWDYNNGLVRMTPFFKSCNYGKTVPAKMLSQNPGLKEITHSITGGTILAQGYWMPYECARAICATFCHNIAGALIPIFGPTFPRDCSPHTNPDVSRMTISPAIISKCASQAQAYRIEYTSLLQNHRRSPGTESVSPSRASHVARQGALESPYYSGRSADSPYMTDTDEDLMASPVVAHIPMAPLQPYYPHLIRGPKVRHMQAPTSNGWNTVTTNRPTDAQPRDVRESSATFSREASVEFVPRLSTLPNLHPRSTSPSGRLMMSEECLRTGKRRMEDEHVASVTRYGRMGPHDLSQYKFSRNRGYTDAVSGGSGSVTPVNRFPSAEKMEDLTLPPITGPQSEVERKDAAMLLMRLSGGKKESEQEMALGSEGMGVMAQEAFDAMNGDRRKSM